MATSILFTVLAFFILLDESIATGSQGSFQSIQETPFFTLIQSNAAPGHRPVEIDFFGGESHRQGGSEVASSSSHDTNMNMNKQITALAEALWNNDKSLNFGLASAPASGHGVNYVKKAEAILGNVHGHDGLPDKMDLGHFLKNLSLEQIDLFVVHGKNGNFLRLLGELDKERKVAKRQNKEFKDLKVLHEKLDQELTKLSL